MRADTGTDTGVAASLLSRASALVPHLKERAVDTERARRVAPEGFDELAELGVLKMCAPKRYGGDELDFQSQVDVLAEIARGCPSTSWVATILSAMAWMAATFPDEVQDEVLGDGDPRVGGALAPTGTLMPTKGGYLLNGRWGYNTGGHGTRWTIVNAIRDGVPASLITKASDFTRLDDWYASGMTGTGSSTIVADDVFVPEHQTQSLPSMINGEYSEARHNASNPYFKLPLASVLAINAGGTPVGIARGAIDAFFERLPGRGITHTTYDDQSLAAVTHLQVGEAVLLADSADDHIRRACALLDAPAAGAPTFIDRVKGRAHIAYATGLARQAVDILFHASGASAIQPNVPIQRFQRDIQALSNHGIMHSQTGTELYGRVLCGLEPNTLLV